MKHSFTRKQITPSTILLTFFFWVSTVVFCCLIAQNDNGIRQHHKKDGDIPFSDDNRLNLFFDRSDCGLNYLAVSVKLTNRADLQQPISNNLEVANITSSLGIEVIGAYLYWVVEGGNNNTTNSLRFTSPIGSERISGTAIGRQSGGKCWGCNAYAASHYRADVSNLVCKTDPNGTYSVSEYPTKWQACNPTPGNCICQDGDTDGATLVIIYKDYNSTFNGHLRLWDGLIYSEQGRVVRTEYEGVNFCAQPTQTSFTTVLSDFQQFGNWQNNRMKVNNRVVPIIPKFYNQETLNLPLSQNNTLTAEYYAENGDCYTIILNAVYGRTANCPQTCAPNFNPPLPTVGSLPSLPFCAGTLPPTLTYSGFSGEVLKWQMTSDCDNGPWTDVIHTSPTYQPENLSQTTCFRVISKANSCLQYSPKARLTMTDRVDAGQTLGSNTYCERAENLRLSLSNRTGTVQFWEYATDPLCQIWNSIANNGSTLNIPLIQQTTCYRTVIKFANCDNAYTQPARIEITPSNTNVTVSGANAICGEDHSITLTLQNLGNHRIIGWESATHCDSLGSWLAINDVNNPLTVNLNQTTCFRAIVKNGSCPQKVTPSHRVEVSRTTEAGVVSNAQTICQANNQVELNLTGQIGSILRWEYVIPNVNESNPIPIANTTDKLLLTNISETRKYRAVVQAGNCETKFSEWVQVTYSDALDKGTLTADQTICSGQNASPLKLTQYKGTIARWEQSVGNANNWFPARLGGQDEFLPLNINEDTWFRVVLTAEGCGEIYSDTVKISIKSGATAGTLAGAMQACERIESANLTLSGFIGNIISWQKRSPTGNWENINHTLSNYNPQNITSTTYYRVEIANNNCGSVFSNPIILQIDEPTVGGDLPTIIDECAQNITIPLTLNNYLGSILYWERSADSMNWVNIGNANNARLNVNGNQFSTYYYRVAVKNNSCSVQYSTVTKVVLRPPSLSGVLSKDSTACADSLTYTLSLRNHQGSITSWEYSTDNGVVWQRINHFSADYRPTITRNTLFRVNVKNGNCPATVSNPISIRLLPPVKGGNLSGSGSICLGQNGHLLELQNYAGRIVRWETSKDLGNTWYSIGKAGFASYKPSRLTITTWFRAILENGPCGTAYSTIGKVEVIPPSLGGVITGGGSFCVLTGQLELINYRGSIKGWEYSPDNGLNWQLIQRTSSIFPMNQIPGNGLFRAIVQNANCSEARSQSTSVKLITSSQGGEIIGTQYICRGGTSGIMILQGYLGRVVRWEVSDNFGVTWRNIPHSLPSYESEPLFGRTYFRALVQNEICEPIYSSIHTIDLVDRLFGGIITANHPVCDPTDEIILTLSGYSGVISHWERSDDNFQTIVTIPHLTPQYTVQNITSSVSFRVKLFSGMCDQVYSASITLTLQPKPKVNAKSFIGCDHKGVIEVTTTGGSGTYTYYRLFRSGFLLKELPYPSNTFTGLEVGTDYSVQVLDANGCTDETNIQFPPKAETPDIIDFPIVMTTQFAVQWKKVPGNNVRYYVQYRINGEMSWKTTELTQSTHAYLQNLQHDTEYEVLIFALCGSDTVKSEVSRFVRTKSLGNCKSPSPPAPGGFYPSFITNNSAQLNWNPLTNGTNEQGYIISYGLADNNPNIWAQWVVCHPTDRLILQNLAQNTVYRARIRSNCTNCTTALQIRDRRSNWSETIEFKTLKSQFKGEGTLSDEDNRLSDNMILYPNPATSQITISWDENVSPQKVMIYNINGQNIGGYAISVEQKEITIPTDHWTAGFYLAEIFLENRVKRIKFWITP